MFAQSLVQESNSSCPCPMVHSQTPFANCQRKLLRKQMSQKNVKNIFVVHNKRKDICTPQITKQKPKRQCLSLHHDQSIAVPAPFQRGPKFGGPHPLKHQTVNNHTDTNSNDNTRIFETLPVLSPLLCETKQSLGSPNSLPLPVCTFVTKRSSKQQPSHNQRRLKRNHNGVTPLDFTVSPITECNNPPRFDSFGVVTPTCSPTSSPSITTTMENLSTTTPTTTPIENVTNPIHPIESCIRTVDVDALAGDVGLVDDLSTTMGDTLDWGVDFGEFDNFDMHSHDTTTPLNTGWNGPENWTRCPVCDNAAASHIASVNATPSLDSSVPTPHSCGGGGGDDDDVTTSPPLSDAPPLSSDVNVTEQVTQLNQPTAHCGFPLLDDESKEVACHIVKVEKGTPEFNDVAASMECCNFEDTGLEVLKVFRVQNPTLYQQFLAKRISDELKPWASSTDNTPRQVFHVTRAKHLEALLVEGLDQRLASRGRFGRGLYFAEDPRKSNQYWKGKGDVKMMLRASVLTGRTKKYQANSIDPSLLREPKGYDSVQGELYGQREFVVYDSARVQIEYIITYQQRGHGAPLV
eukprot:m.33848 g.33848  ORF g.33848 m.33848 type:complete len:577 (-) comp16881_c1_seq1:359-2089(-)